MIKTQNLYLAFIIAISFLNFSCSVSSSQLGSFTDTNPQPKMKNYFWNVTYDNLNYQLIAIDLPNGTLFADKFGNSLFFDGWSIGSIVGFGDFEGEYDIRGDEIGSVDLIDDNSYIVTKNCGKWVQNQINKGVIFIQYCGNNKEFMNKITINSSNEIIEIKQYIEPSNKLMTLTKSNSIQ